MWKNVSVAIFCSLLFVQNATAQTLYDFNTFTTINTPVFTGANFKAIGIGKAGFIWAGTQYQGLYRYSPTLKTWEKFNGGLTNVFINDIKTDRKGGIWIAQAGTSGLQGGGSNIAGGVNYFKDSAFTSMSFYSITSGGGLTSRNARSIWVDTFRNNQDTLPKVWTAQGTYITSSVTTAGGISTGLNNAANYFAKIYNGLQVTPFVTAPNAGTPSCISIAGDNKEAWAFALTNFGKSQILRYRTDAAGNTFIGAYDNNTTPLLSTGLRANAMYFDGNDRKWLGLSNNGLIIKDHSSWKFMNDTSIFPIGTSVNPNAITSDEDGNVLIGTTNGLVIYYNGPVDSATSYRRITTLNGLPTNNINHIAVDTANSRLLLATDVGIVFMKQRKNIDVQLKWDYSFPNPAIKPKGVVADGAARLYLRVRKMNDTLPAIKKVQVQLDNYVAAFKTLRGKLKKADTLDRYTSEANTGTSNDVNRTDSTNDGSFWFWYVAPDDFCLEETAKESKLAERNDSVKVKVTYANDAVDSIIVVLKVTRPPVIFSTMISKTNTAENSDNPGARPLGSGGENTPAMFGIGNIIKGITNDLFTKVNLQMNFTSQISGLLKSILDPPQQKLAEPDVEPRRNMLWVILDMRRKGFACNRADFIGHGPVVNVLRAAIAAKPKQFYANNAGLFNFNNFGMGFLNKILAINAPNLGAPIFDMLNKFVGKNSPLSELLLKANTFAKPAQQEPYQFFKVDSETGESEGNRLLSSGQRPAMFGIGKITAKLAPLIAQLAYPDTIGSAIAGLLGGSLSTLAPLKNHLIASNAAVAAQNWNLIPMKGPFGKVMDLLTMFSRDNFPLQKGALTSLFDSANSPIKRILGFLDIAHNAYGSSTFSASSDFLLPLGSMLGGLSPSNPAVTVLTNSSPDSVDAMHANVLTKPGLGDMLVGLLNTKISSPAFNDSIPTNYTNFYRRPQVLEKPVVVRYDTSRIVIESRSDLTNPYFKDTTLTVRYRIKDSTNLQYIYIAFQDTSYTTLRKTRNQQISMKIKTLMEYSGTQEVSALAVYEKTDSIIYYVDTLNLYVVKPAAVTDFRVTEAEADLYNGNLFYPAYEVKVKGEWETLRSDDSLIVITPDGSGNAVYDSATLSFDAAGDGYSRVYFQYKSFKDTVGLNCQLSFAKTAVNKTLSSGNFKNAAIWSKGWVPQPEDSVVIVGGHAVILDTTVQIRSLRIDSLASLTLNNPARTLQLGSNEDGDFMLDNYGTLNISNGVLTVRGRVKLNRASRFNMTGGNLIVDGNTGNTITSLQNGLFLFDAAPQMTSFVFTGGILQIIDPPIGVSSQAISCSYNFGINSTLILGNGISLTAANNPNGFGGAKFPPQIGRLILDAGTAGGNRQLTITKPLNVKGSFEIKAGSNLIIKAQTTVTQ